MLLWQKILLEIAKSKKKIIKTSRVIIDTVQLHYSQILKGVQMASLFGFSWVSSHCKPRQVKPTNIECGHVAMAMQIIEVNLFELGPT